MDQNLVGNWFNFGVASEGLHTAEKMCIVLNMLFPSFKTQFCSISFGKFTQTKLGSSEPHRNAACDSLSFVVYFVTYTIYDGNTKIHRE